MNRLARIEMLPTVNPMKAMAAPMMTVTQRTKTPALTAALGQLIKTMPMRAVANGDPGNRENLAVTSPRRENRTTCSTMIRRALSAPSAAATSGLRIMTQPFASASSRHT
jgi:hypothetical protein